MISPMSNQVNLKQVEIPQETVLREKSITNHTTSKQNQFYSRKKMENDLTILPLALKSEYKSLMVENPYLGKE